MGYLDEINLNNIILANGAFSEKGFLEKLTIDEFYTELLSYKRMKDLEAEEYRKINEKSSSPSEGRKRITRSDTKRD